MKIRYLKKRAIRKAEREERRRQAKREYQERIAKWHPKFVLWPRKIETPEDDTRFATVVFFETIWQKGRLVHNTNGFEIAVWTRHTEKEYFMKKLNGTLEAEEQFFNDDVIVTGSATQGTMTGVRITKGKI